jgi:hypothetical protein
MWEDKDIKIPSNFPNGCSKAELNDFISKLSKEAEGLGLDQKSSIPRYAQRAHIASLLQLAQSEKRDRLSTRLFWLSTFVSGLSAIAAVVALVFSYLSYNSSDNWEDKQLTKFEKLINSIESSNQEATQSNAEGFKAVEKAIIDSIQKLESSNAAAINNNREEIKKATKASVNAGTVDRVA